MKVIGTIRNVKTYSIFENRKQDVESGHVGINGNKISLIDMAADFTEGFDPQRAVRAAVEGYHFTVHGEVPKRIEGMRVIYTTPIDVRGIDGRDIEITGIHPDIKVRGMPWRIEVENTRERYVGYS